MGISNVHSPILVLPKGDNARILRVPVPLSNVTTGALNTGRTFSQFGAWYAREGEAAKTVLTPQSIAALGTYQAPTTATDIRIGHFADGLYEFHLRNELLADGVADTVHLRIHESGSEAAPSTNNIPPIDITIQLTTLDLNSEPATIDQLWERRGVLLVKTTIATLTSQTQFTLVDGPPDNDALNGRTIVITDASNPLQFKYGLVIDYVGSTKAVTLLADPGIFTIQAGDHVAIVVDPIAVDGYWSRLQFLQAGAQEEYTVYFVDKSTLIEPARIGSPTIKGILRLDGATLFGPTALTQVPGTRYYKHDETVGLVGDGETTIAEVTATIDGQTRTWPHFLGRDT